MLAWTEHFSVERVGIIYLKAVASFSGERRKGLLQGDAGSAGAAVRRLGCRRFVSKREVC